MLLNSIEYQNFRPFIGKQKISLEGNPNNPETNVTVLLGDNTFGKSTFVLSFIWCLYGESRFNRPDDILNKKIEASLKPGESEVAIVKVKFEDNGLHYVMERTQRFTKRDSGSIKADESVASLTYTDKDGKTDEVGPLQENINLAIRSILPVDLSSFFFFEGEKNNEITRKDLGKAVRTLLGLEAYDKMRSHLYGSQTQNVPYTNSVMGTYLKKQNDESGDKAQAEYDKMKAAEGEMQAATERQQEIDKDIDYYNNEIERINEELRQAAPSKELQKRRDDVAVSIKRSEESLKKLNKNLLSRFSKDSLPLFFTPLLKPAAKRLAEMDVADKGIQGIELKAIQELLNRGECLCGTDLKEGSLAYKNVEKYIEYVPPRSLGILVKDMIESIDEISEKNLNFAEEFEDIYKDIVGTRTTLNELDKTDRALLAQIAETGVVDTKLLEEKMARYKRVLRELGEERDLKINEAVTKKTEMETAEKNFNALKSKSDKAKEFQLYYKYAEAIYNWVDYNYSIKEDSLRNRLNEYISDLFDSMYSGKRDIEIDDNYNINMTVDGDVVDDTGGLRVIQYFAYVGGLVKLAYEIMKERESDEDGNQETLGEQYPLVLDAAFSHADDTHTQNIARALSGAASQLIFAIMKKDWLYAKEGLVGKVGKMYELRKIDEKEVHITEVQ